MNKKIVLIAIAVFLILVIASITGIKPAVKSGSLNNINMPQGFKIEVFADSLDGSSVSYPGPNPGPRMMLLKDNVLFVTIPNTGKVVALPDMNGDKKADSVVTFIDKLNNPHGIDYYDGWFYIAEENRAAIIKCNTDGTGCSVYARGLRNSVGFVFHPATGMMYATENGRDVLGDDLPPDEINIIEEGKNYGWPICYGKNIHDTDFDKSTQRPWVWPFTPGTVFLRNTGVIFSLLITVHGTGRMRQDIRL